MIRNFEESDLETNKLASAFSDDKAATRSRISSALRNLRIVRVPRSFGCKLSTVRGLRDRRVRLSVPTAIQAYRLQDKLGFNRPSKVVDWLTNSAQDAIDKLPLFQFPPANFIQFPQYEVELPCSQPTSSRLDNSAIHSKDEEVGLVTGPTNSSLQGLAVYNQWENSAVHCCHLGNHSIRETAQYYDRSTLIASQVEFSSSIFASEVSQMNVDAKHCSQVHMPSLVSETLSNIWAASNESFSDNLL